MKSAELFEAFKLPKAFEMDALASKILPAITSLNNMDVASESFNVWVQNNAAAPDFAQKLSNLKAFFSFKESLRQKKGCLVFTNGVFDLLHRGHLSYLMASRNRGDALIVALNTDASVKQLNKKGDRPINPLSERLFMLSALAWVDFVIPFEENTPVELLQKIQPQLYTKAGDYTLAQLPEVPVMESLGGTVEIIPFEAGFSSSQIIAKAAASLKS